jgi:hypothetical protein
LTYDETLNQEHGSVGSASMCAPMAPSPLYATPATLTRPLRMLLVAPERVPQWLSTFVEIAAGCAWITVSVLPVSGAELPAVSRVPAHLRLLLAFERLVRRRPNPSLSAVEIGGQGGVAVEPAVPANMELVQVGSCARKLQPDLVLSLGPAPWSEVLADCTRLGCWNIDANLVDARHAGLGLLACLAKRDSATELALELDGASRSPWSRAASFGATRYGSFTAQRETAFRKLPLLLLRMLHRLAADDLAMPPRVSVLRQTSGPTVGLIASARALATTFATTLQWRVQKNRRPIPWHLVFRQESVPLDPGAPQVRTSATLQAPRGNYWADPCAIEVAGRQLVFVEEMNRTRKGVIACLELGHESASRFGLALEEQAHLSYPQVFQWNDQWYMTVESAQMQRVSLYQAISFPLGWQRVGDLIYDRVCADPTLHFHEGRWYLFTTVAENRNGTWDELFLFVSDDLTGPFKPHPANPIVSDVRRARPAGRLFVHEGRLIRPAQDCAANYGSALVFNHVVELSPTHYQERTLSRLAPDWADSLVACHTYSAAGALEVLDARGYPAAGTPRLQLVDRSARLDTRESAPAAMTVIERLPADTR